VANAKKNMAYAIMHKNDDDDDDAVEV